MLLLLFEVVIALLVAVILWLYYSDRDEPMDKLPGPKRLPIIGNCHQLTGKPNDQALGLLSDLVKAFGDRFSLKMMRIRLLQISRPSDIEIILSHPKNISKSLPYSFLQDWLGSGLLISTGAHWHKRRKILTPAFHFNILKNFASVMEENSRELVNLLKEKKEGEVDVFPVISDFTLFTICETAMGTKLDKDKSAASVNYKKSILELGLHILNRARKVWLWPTLIYKQSASGKEFYRRLATIRSFAENVIMDRKAHRTANKKEDVTADKDSESKKRLAMLDLLLEAEEQGEIDLDGIKDEVNTFMFEGHDTTAVAITFCLMLLADHEDIQDQILWEIQGILNNSDRSPSMSDLADMKYMEAVIKEALRLYPSVPIYARQVDEDFMLDDLLVKQGTLVNLLVYDLHRREDMFPDPEAFKPERFLPGTELKHPFSYVPFSAGPRNCIGQRFAMIEMKITLCEIIQNFKLVPKEKGARPKLVADMVLRPATPVFVKFVPRK